VIAENNCLAFLNSKNVILGMYRERNNKIDRFFLRLKAFIYLSVQFIQTNK